MAIEKNYLSTFGWEVPDAYYKVNDDYHMMPNETNVWNFNVNVYRNQAARNLDNAPLATNHFKVTIAEDVDTNDVDSMKTAAYNALKDLTNSFRTESTDV